MTDLTAKEPPAATATRRCITAYRFGRIDVEGRPYQSDVIITPEAVNDGWWRRDGHRVAASDLTDVVGAKPDILVIGTGYFGRMVVSDEARHYLKAQGIQLREARTRQAIVDFNRLQTGEARVVAALHVTC